jgi:IS30 family transposase
MATIVMGQDEVLSGGHWEGDLITGESNRSAIGTLVERTSRYVVLLHLPGRHTAKAVRDAVIDAMKDLPAHLRRSLTWDQGSEMALHAEIAHTLGMPVYVCEKASPWQRPSNENRQFLEIVANHLVAGWRCHCRMIWLGLLSFRHSRGRSFSSAAISWS